MSRSVQALAFGLAAVALAVTARDAQAAPPRDKPALKLDDEAMGRDYLETNFLRAQKKLAQALSLCGASACSKAVVAMLHRDLGVVLIGGLSKNAEGKQEFVRALEVEPGIELDPDFATPNMKKIWVEAKSGKASPPPGPRSGEPHVVHTVLSEALVATPLPVFASFEGPEAPSEMRLWYKGPGAKVWAHLAMKKIGDGFGASVPCAATAHEGKLVYFVAAQASDGETIAREGSRDAPHAVEIKKELEGATPHFPDEAPPAHCTDVACHGAECGRESTPPPPAASEVRRNWVTLLVEQDLALVSGATGVCTETIQLEGGWSCFRPAGSQYHGNPVHGRGDDVSGGLAPATTRIHVGFDRVLGAGLVVGLRAGAVLHGAGPRPDGAAAHASFPAHLEMRFAYWFGSDVFSTAGFRPFLFGSAGAAQVDASFAVPVAEDRSKPPPVGQIDNPGHQTLQAWREMGQAFAGGGLGAMYAFTPGFGLILDVKYMHLFPSSGNVVAPEAGFGVGF